MHNQKKMFHEWRQAILFLLVFICILYYQPVSAASVWTANSEFILGFSHVNTSSSDGSKLVVADDNGNMYISNDGGLNWVANHDLTGIAIYAITSSADGLKLAIATGGDYIYTSSDGGANWIAQINSGQSAWNSITSSDDGLKLAATQSGGYVYTSIDGGVNWTERTGAGQRDWAAISSSANGLKLFAANILGYIYTSIDGGETWTEQSDSGERRWFDIESSADGSKLIASVSVDASTDYIYTSVDGGVNWVMQSALGLGDWKGVSISDDGQYMAGIDSETSHIFLSTDGGLTWQLSLSDFVDLYSLTFSADGTKLFSTGLVEYFYIYGEMVQPKIIAENISIASSSDIGLNFFVSTFHTTHGFEYGLTTGYGESVSESGNFELGNYNMTVSGLTPKVIYHYRSFATNSLGTSYSEDRTFSIQPLIEQTSSGARSWSAITSSADGTRIVASLGGSSLASNYIYYSTDAGVTWIRSNSGTRKWNSLTSSVDGLKMAGATDGSYVFTSVDGGVNWASRTAAGSRAWRSITSSADGTKLAAVANNNYIYTSVNSGGAWTPRLNTVARAWSSITSSADGTRLAATVNNDYIYTSIDSGVSWTMQANSGRLGWNSITSSADGLKLFAVAGGAFIFVSLDGGVNWEQRYIDGEYYNFSSISSSADGNKLVALDIQYSGNKKIHTSSDGGISWTTQIDAGQRFWSGAYVSAEGNSILAIDNTNNISPGGYVYIYNASSSLPTVSNTRTSVLRRTSATLEANIISTGAEYITSRGFEYGLTDSYGVTVSEEGSFISGLFTHDINSLACGKVYHYRAFVINSVGAAYSEDKTFPTGDCVIYSWTERPAAGQHNWAEVTSSDNGLFLAAINSDDSYIYTSTSSGAIWEARTNAGSRAWSSISSSADGLKLVAAVNNGYIYTSTDGGETWVERINSGSRAWSVLDSADDGLKLIAAVNNGYIYTSTDGGETWVERINSGSLVWASVHSANDGLKLTAAVIYGYIYTSTDGGETWVERINSGYLTWSAVDSADDGLKLVAAVNNGLIYTSSDSGVNWTAQTGSGIRAWKHISSSNDGTRLVAVASGDYIYTSSDSGANWMEQTSSGVRDWIKVDSSGDAYKLIAAVNGGSLYTYDRALVNIPELTTNAFSSAINNVVTLNGFILTDNAANNIRGFEYGLDTSYGSSTIENGSFDAGSFTANVASLTPGLVYHYRAYATNDLGIGYGLDNTFIVKPFNGVNNSGSLFWSFLDSSADGTKLFMVDHYGFIYTGLGGGSSWTQQTTSGRNSWSSITASADGSKLAAATNLGYIYSSDDGGASWTENTGAGRKFFTSIISSADGSKLATTAWGDYVYTSNDDGGTWIERTNSGQKHWKSIAASGDATKLVAATSNGYVYTSNDFGSTWTERVGSGQRNWISVSSSADGAKLIAAVSNGYVYVSSDGGINWSEQIIIGSRNWRKVVSSNSGLIMAAVSLDSSSVYTSLNGGLQWTEQKIGGNNNWQSLTISDNGDKIVVSSSQAVYVYSVVVATPSNTSSTISWTTEQPSSSKIEYGLTSDYGTSTVELDLSPLVTVHNVSISGLAACTTYHYRFRSTLANHDEIVGADNVFTTLGCTASSVSKTTVSKQITSISGGTVTLKDANSDGLVLSIPASFSELDANFQIHQLDKTAVLNNISSPTEYSVGNYLYELKALSGISSVVSAFDDSLTVSMNYNQEDISGLIESDLKIYRWDEGIWTQLTDCTVDTTNKIVTCSTNHFSTFGIFGNRLAVVSSGGSSLPFEATVAPLSPNGGFNVNLNNGALYTNKPVLSLSLNAGSDSVNMAISNTPDFKIASQEKYVSKKDWNICGSAANCPSGTYTVYVKFYTKWGQSSGIFMDSIVYQAGVTDNSQSIQISTSTKPLIKNIYSFSRNLKIGQTDEDVKLLQKFLNSKGYLISKIGPGSPGKETKYFGMATKNALMKFQRDKKIKPVSGYFGPLTRKSISSEK